MFFFVLHKVRRDYSLSWLLPDRQHTLHILDFDELVSSEPNRLSYILIGIAYGWYPTQRCYLDLQSFETISLVFEGDKYHIDHLLKFMEIEELAMRLVTIF